jgi:WD40 repeat protein/transcriptional regulator with XRE-family HTH domain
MVASDLVAVGISSADTFRGLMLGLRGRTRLTQQQLASRLGVSTRTIQYWETGVSYPGAANLKALIAAYLDVLAFAPGLEQQEAHALWESARFEAPRLGAPFDETWFSGLLASKPGALAEPSAGAAQRRQDWGEAPRLNVLYGRSAELDTLKRWTVDERCRVVVLVGMGGIGKTALATQLAIEIATGFDFVYWRSLGLGLPPQFWLARAIAYLSDNQMTPAPEFGEALQQLTTLLRERRCLLVLDNFETVVESGASAAGYREDFAEYATIVRQLAQTNHESCLILTSREKPPGFGVLEGTRAPARSFRVDGLNVEASRALLQEVNLAADQSRWEMLVERYGGNALALRVVAESIDELFAGDVDAFLTQTNAVFGDIRRLLDEHVQRLPPLELEILYWLAIEREPLSFAMLQARMLRGATRAETLEALEALRRRSLVEHGDKTATFVLQPVIQDYIVDRIVETVARELASDQHDVVRRFPLVKGTAPDWVRSSQERFLGAAVLERLEVAYGSGEALERRFLQRLAWLRMQPPLEQGWEPGTLVNLLRLHRGHLQAVDLSGLHLRQVYLQQVEAQDASLAGAELAQSLVTDAFNFTRSVALSSDGTYLAAGTSNGEVRLWNVADRTPLLAVRAHTSMVFGLALSSSGQLASGGADGIIRLWRASDGGEAGSLVGHAGMVYGLVYSADGNLLFSSGLDGSVRIWDVRSGECHAQLASDASAKLAVAVNEDRRFAVCGALDGALLIWDLVDQTSLTRFQGHAGPTRSVAVDASGTLMASAGDDGHFRLWRLPLGELLLDRDTGDGGIFQVAMSRDGRLCVTGSSNGTVRVWETATGMCVATLSEHANIVFSVGLTGDGSMAASGSLDGTIRLWSVASARCTATIHSYMGGVRTISMSGQGDRFATGSVDGTVRLWATRSGALESTLRPQRGALMSVKLSVDARRLVIAGNGPVQLWSVSPAQRLSSLSGHRGMVYGLALPNDASKLATAGVDGTLRLWDLSTGERASILASFGSPINNIAISGDGRLLAAAVLGHAFELWSIDDKVQIASLPMGRGGTSWGIALSEDGRVLAGGGEDGQVHVWDVASKRLIRTLQAHTGGALSCALTRDGHRLATSGGDGQVRLWSVDSGEAIATWHEHVGGVWAVDISRDGQWLVSGGLDGTVRVWNADKPDGVHVRRPDRPYERMDITGLTGVTDAQRVALLSLGAVETSVTHGRSVG